MTSVLPALNASMNAGCFVCLCTGFVLIKRGRRTAHARAMIAATVFGAVFLAGYLYYHVVVQPVIGPTRFHGAGWTRPAYFVLLITHVVLAGANVPLVLVTLWHAWKRNWPRHRRLAKVTFPIWLYVSITGVLVYFVLYHWNPPAPQ